MPEIRCSKCGHVLFIDAVACPYSGEVGCPQCKNIMEVIVTGSGSGTQVKTLCPNPRDDLSTVWHMLNEVERDYLEEAALAIGHKAYTAAELMSLKTLESLAQRFHRKVEGKEFEGTLFGIIDAITDDKEFEPYADAIDYLRRVRNRLTYPDRVSTKLDAESTYKMSLRLAKELATLIGE